MHAFNREQLYRVGGRWEDYTNFGILQDFKDSGDNIFPLHIDTWYYDNAINPLGHMDLRKIGTKDHLDTGAFLAQQAETFSEAFSGLVQLHTIARVGYRPPEERIRSFALNSSMDRLTALAQELPGAIILGSIIRFDVLVTLRGPDGYIGDIWLRNVGDLQLFGGIVEPPPQSSGNSARAAGHAILQLDVASLFMSDNQTTLVQTRNQWKRIREIDPTVTIDLREDSPASPVVTLVDPPSSTPLDNQELFEKNGPRLAQAISIWEDRTRCPFIWEIRGH